MLVLVIPSTLVHCAPDLFKPRNNILRNRHFNPIDVLMVDGPYRCLDEPLVDALAQHGAGLEDETHLLLAEAFA